MSGDWPNKARRDPKTLAGSVGAANSRGGAGARKRSPDLSGPTNMPRCYFNDGNGARALGMISQIILRNGLEHRWRSEKTERSLSHLEAKGLSSSFKLWSGSHAELSLFGIAINFRFCVVAAAHSKLDPRERFKIVLRLEHVRMKRDKYLLYLNWERMTPPRRQTSVRSDMPLADRAPSPVRSSAGSARRLSCRKFSPAP